MDPLPPLISRAGLARWAKLSPQRVEQLALAGRLDVDPSSNLIDTAGPRTLEWLATREAPPLEALPTKLAEVSASLGEREFDALLITANSVSTAALREELLAEAAAWRGCLTQAPEELALLLGQRLGRPPDEILPLAESAVRAVIGEQTDADAIEAELTRAHQAWHAHPPRRMTDPPELGPWVPPGALAEALRRRNDARRTLSQLRTDGRAGVVLAKPAAAYAALTLRQQWCSSPEIIATHCGATFGPFGPLLDWAAYIFSLHHLIGRLAPVFGRYDLLRGVALGYLYQAEFEVLRPHRAGLPPWSEKPVLPGQRCPPREKPPGEQALVEALERGDPEGGLAI
jgi:hypothetical protein